MLHILLTLGLLGGIFGVLATDILKLKSKYGVIGDVIVGGIGTIVLVHILGLLGTPAPVGLVEYVVVGFVGGFGFTTVVKKLIPAVL